MIGGAVVNWKSSLSSVTTLSTTEAEASAASCLAREMLWLCQWKAEMGMKVIPMHIGIDNLGALRTFQGSAGAGMRHTDYRINHLRCAIADGLFVGEHVGTKWNIADAMSKPMKQVSQFRWIRDQLMTLDKR